EIKKKIREVLFHEIGHYFGFKEEDLRKMGCG
ncbi:metallopeptidase family protein, partial [Candidatus Calescamantes bacterium]|nr:metallopeptidase family protein [Candidatus Calescamantes bacterium]